MAFDVGSSKLAKSNFALGYSAGNMTVHSAVNNGSEFGGSLHQKHSDKLETAVNVSYARCGRILSLMDHFISRQTTFRLLEMLRIL